MLIRHCVEGVPNAAFAYSASGQCWAANARACALMKVETPPRTLAQTLSSLPAALAEQLQVLWQRYQQGMTPGVLDASFKGLHYRVHGASLGEAGSRQQGIMFSLEEVTQQVRQEIQLEVFRQGVANYRDMQGKDARWHFMLDALKRLTNSEYALIGETVDRFGSLPSLRIHAISDLSWSAESRCLMERLRSGEMTLSNADSLLGRVFAHGETVLTDDLAHHPQRGGFPPGHPTIYNFLGIPIHDGGKTIGMLGVANTSQGYTSTLAEELAPFVATCGLLINLYRDSRSREEMLLHLESARDQAERANRAKDDFLASMSHELRTPLNSILGYGQLLESSSLPAKGEEFTACILHSGQQLLALIDNLLDFANLDHEPSPAMQVPVSLQDIFKELHQYFQPLAKRRDITLLPWHADNLWVSGDSLRIRRILSQLISNAIKFQPAGGQVGVETIRQSGQVGVTVVDQGKGIDPANHADVFVPFNRLDAGMSAVEGTGVGLSLAAKLAKSLEGDITLESQLGQGARFTLWLAETTPQASISTLPTDQNAVSPGYRLIYVEDNKINQRLMGRVLEKWHNLQVDMTETAEEGLRQIQQHAYDLVLMDISLPGMDGYEALRRLKADPDTAHLPVIAVSAHASDNDVQRGLAQGFRHYLTKPINVARLGDALSTCLLLQDVDATPSGD